MTLSQGDRICLRRMRVSDLDVFALYRSDPDVARYQSWEPMDLDEMRGFLQANGTVAPLLRPGAWVQIAVADLARERLLGDLGIYLSPDGSQAELGLTLARGAQGKGYAQDAVRLACSLIFERKTVGRIWGIADLRNLASLRLLQRCGFVTDREEETDGICERFTYLDRPSASRAAGPGHLHQTPGGE